MTQTVCTRCVMDRSAKEIVFDENGVCNFCREAAKSLAEIEAERPNLERVISEIQKAGRGGEYDCLIGLSGGADSSTALHHAVRLGLRPLCYSVDNGWNDPRADENIMRLVETLKVPFYRWVVDFKKFRSLQSAFIKAGQINIEIPTDHILMATSYEMASKNGIRHIISGGNVATESIMPRSWGYQPRDLTHIRAVYRWAMGAELSGLPTLSLLRWNYYHWVKRIRTLYILDHLDYNRAESIKMLGDTYGWKNYYEKHCESTFTWWFQNYYLYEKFGIDKRKAHLSSMIQSGQMMRKEAMDILTTCPEYPKLGLEEKVLQYKERPYTDFATDEKLFDAISSFVRGIKRWFS